jgi:glycine/D-amino acid oxidase-like deaminating enzyme
LNGLVMSPTVYLRQSPSGRLIGSADFDGVSERTGAAALFAQMKATLRANESIAFDFSVVAHRPQPADGLPAVGRLGAKTGVYLAMTHSGVTLAPLIGRLISDEIIDGRQSKLLEPYRPTRFS